MLKFLSGVSLSPSFSSAAIASAADPAPTPARQDEAIRGEEESEVLGDQPHGEDHSGG